MIEKKLLKFEAKGRAFAKILRSLEQFIQPVKEQYDFCNRILFNLRNIFRAQPDWTYECPVQTGPDTQICQIDPAGRG